MRTPIAHCLAWPERSGTAARKLDLAEIGVLSFDPADYVRFPALRVAREALEHGGGSENILNAANEIAVAAFLAGRIGFLEIARIVEETVAHAIRVTRRSPASIEEAFSLDAEGRRIASELVAKNGSKAGAP